MNNAKNRIELIVLDLIERMSGYNYVKIVREYSTLYLGYYNRIPKELLNEKVIRINTLDCTDVPLLIEIE
jgi:hypothetical protein